jgi:hypothetical protein
MIYVVRTPRSRWSLLLGLLLAYCATPLAVASYYSTELRRGAYPVEADSIGIPIYQSVFVLLTMIPVVFIAGWMAVRNYRPSAVLWAWAPSRPLAAAFWSTFLVAAALAQVLVAVALAQTGHGLPAIHASATAYMSLLLRASIVAGLERAIERAA